jgi:hypothetical protein
MVGLYFSRHCINRAQFFVAESNSTCTDKLLPGCPNALEPLANNRDSVADKQAGTRIEFHEPGRQHAQTFACRVTPIADAID